MLKLMLLSLLLWYSVAIVPVFSFYPNYEYYELDVYGETVYGYYVKIYLGTPPQKVNLLLDTGSSNFAVSCFSVGKKVSHFKCHKSTTCDTSPVKITLRYVSGNWEGFIANDILKISANDSHSFKLQFACMTSITDMFEKQSQFQGLLGLAYPEISKPDDSIIPFFESLIEKKNVQNIFSLSLCGPFLSSHQQKTSCGTLHLGYLSELYNKGDVIYTPIRHEWYYEVMLTDLKVGEMSLPVPCFDLNNPKSIVDSGTSELKFPEVIYDWVIEALKNLTELQFSETFWHNHSTACIKESSDITSFPTLTVSFYHTSYSMFSILIGPQLYLLRIPNKDFCFKLGLSRSESSFGTIVGATVLKGFYVVFDRENKQIGFANHTIKDFDKDVGTVQLPVYAVQSSLQCDGVRSHTVSSLAVGVYILAALAILWALIFLFFLVIWIFKNFIWKKVDRESDSMFLLTEEEI